MVRNGCGAKYIWYEMVSGYGTKLQFCGTKWLWCKIHMVRNCNFVVRNGYGAKFIWYEMVSGYGTKLQFCGMKCQWYEMVMVRNDLLRYVRGYLQSSENGRVVTIAFPIKELFPLN